MPTMMRLYRDGPAYLAAARRIETRLLPDLLQAGGLQHFAMLRLFAPDSAGSLGLCVVSYQSAGQLREAVSLGTHWSQHHLPDLLPALQPSSLLKAEVIFTQGRLP